MMAALEHYTGGLWPYLVVILVGFLPSEIWRWSAVFLSKGIREDAEILIWVKAVASALLAGVVAKLVLTPNGALATIPLFWRIASLIGGVAGFYLFRRSILAGVIAGEIVLIGAGLYFSG
ncbi:MAG: AzlD domain-containing protein [Rhabdaerophilum sp.]